MPAEKKTVLLIDTFGLLYRFYYTLPKMKTSDGKFTSTIYGLSRVLIKIMTEMKPDYLVVAMESRTPTFRHERYAQYKATREKMPDDLREQLPIVEELIEVLGITPAQMDGFEADDVIGTLCRIGSEKDYDVKVITGDKDLLQLVDGNVRVMMSKKGITEMVEFDREMVKQEMGVYPGQVPDKKGLEGDSSDNIPGVPGVGPKTAVPLIEKYGSLEKLYESLDEIERKTVRAKLEDNREMAFFSKELATIERKVPLETGIEDYRLTGIDEQKLAAFLSRYEFTTILKELDIKEKDRPAAAEQIDSNYRMVCDEKEIVELLDRARRGGVLCIDLETTGLDPQVDEVVGYALAVEAGEAVYVPVGHARGGSAAGDMFGGPDGAECDPDSGRQLSNDRVAALLKPVLEDPAVEKWGHNIKFDMLMLRKYGLRMINIGVDTMVAAYVSDPSERRFGLKPLAGELLGITMKTYEDMVGKGKGQKNFSEVPIAEAVDYACADVDMVLRIQPILDSKLKEAGLDKIFREMEMPLVPVLEQMEWNGIAIDSNVLKSLSEEMIARENSIREDAFGITGMDVNLNSPKQVAELLFDALGLRKIRKTSTDIMVLEQLQDDHPVVPLIIQYRHLSKLRGTYIDALPSLVSPRDGRIHTSFNQTVAATGRLSSSNPNLQNIPVRTEEGRKIRRAFVPGGSGCVLLSADYSQIEIRLLAELSGDPILIEAFRAGEDIHTRTAAGVFGVSPGEVTADQRRYAKTINFGLIYGMREFKLSQQLGITRGEAAEFIQNYFARYPKVHEFIESTKKNLMEEGCAITMFGRRRNIPELRSSNKNIQESGLRAGFNTRIQGTAADIIKLAMLDVHGMIEGGGLDARMLLQVHDELLFEVPENKVAEAAQKVRDAMENCVSGHVDLSVELKVDVKAGSNWNDMDKIQEPE